MNSRKTHAASAGFSIVELALALLIAGLGVLTVFNLFPKGLDASRKSVEASEVSVFGNWVMDSLESQSLIVGQSNTWDSDFANNQPLAKTPISHAMVSAGQPIVQAKGQTAADVQVYYVKPDFYASLSSLGQAAYYAFSTFTYTLDVDIDTNGTTTSYARLEVWPGDQQAAVAAALGAGAKQPGGTVFYRTYVPRYLLPRLP